MDSNSPQQTDALEFTKTHLHELQARLASVNDPGLEGWKNANYKLSAEEVAQKFLDDQGLEFSNVDITAILALTKEVHVNE